MQEEQARRDFRVLGIRRLEVSVRRQNDKQLSMIIEKLADQPRHAPFLFGKCIHLDTSAPMGTNMANDVLDHLDFAINIYKDRARAERLTGDLSEMGRVVIAVPRTHLLRVENVPFRERFHFANRFPLSERLPTEWYADQFR